MAELIPEKEGKKKETNGKGAECFTVYSPQLVLLGNLDVQSCKINQLEKSSLYENASAH